MRALAEDAGHRVAYQSVHEEGWERVLDRPADLVAAAGGDGTVGAAMRLLAGGPTPLTILPCGTANNIATALGLTGRALPSLVRGWAEARRVRYVLGRVETATETTEFVEAIGGGIVAAAMERAQALERDDTSSELGLRALRELVDELPAARWELELDGEEAGGRFLAVDVMIVGFTGPSLPFAPQADPSDELFDVVTIGDGERQGFARYLDRRLAGEEPPVPALPVRRAARVTVVPPAEAGLRLDDEPWEPAARELRASTGAAVELWLP